MTSLWAFRPSKTLHTWPPSAEEEQCPTLASFVLGFRLKTLSPFVRDVSMKGPLRESTAVDSFPLGIHSQAESHQYNVVVTV